jgi:hypothetical protein
MKGTALSLILPEGTLILDAISEIACAVLPERTLLNQN